MRRNRENTLAPLSTVILKEKKGLDWPQDKLLNILSQLRIKCIAKSHRLQQFI